MAHIIDAEKLKEVLKRMSIEERGLYMSKQVQGMIDGNCQESWLVADQETKRKGAPYSEAFETFWKAYPPRQGVRTGKQPAYKAWEKQLKAFKLKEEELLDKCLKALDWQKRTTQWQEERGKYVPMPPTYLNQARWEDEQPEDTRPRKGYVDINGIYHEA